MKKTSYYLIIILVVGITIISFWAYTKYFKKEAESILTVYVERGDIQEVVRARGGVVAKKDFDLSFPFVGIVEKVFIEEGQGVLVSQALMKLETTDFWLEIKQLEASLAQNEASLNKLIAGPTVEELYVLETKVINAEKALEDDKENLKNVKVKAENDLANKYDGVLDILNDAYVKAYDALNNQVDEIFTNDDSDNPKLTFSVSGSQNKADSESQRVEARDALSGFNLKIKAINVSDFSALDQAMNDVVNYLNDIRDFLSALNVTLNNSVGLSSSVISGYQAKINTGRTNLNMGISNINDKMQNISAQKITNQNNITLARTSVNNAQSALDLAGSELELKKIGTRSEDISIAEAVIKETRSRIAIVQEKIKKSTIYSPAIAKIVKIWFEEKELFSVGNPAISLSSSGFKIQTDISELEIGKIGETEGSEVVIEFDAFPERKFMGKVLSIDSKEIIKDDDKYYRVNIGFENNDANIRSGMSADLVFNTILQKDVLRVPEIAVYEKDGKDFVRIPGSGIKEAEILTGISDGYFIEVLEGLEEGQAIVISTD